MILVKICTSFLSCENGFKAFFAQSMRRHYIEQVNAKVSTEGRVK